MLQNIKILAVVCTVFVFTLWRSRLYRETTEERNSVLTAEGALHQHCACLQDTHDEVARSCITSLK